VRPRHRHRQRKRAGEALRPVGGPLAFTIFTIREWVGCSHVYGLFSLGGLAPCVRPLWLLAMM
jgi:hypothetical protein